MESNNHDEGNEDQRDPHNLREVFEQLFGRYFSDNDDSKDHPPIRIVPVSALFKVTGHPVFDKGGAEGHAVTECNDYIDIYIVALNASQALEKANTKIMTEAESKDGREITGYVMHSCTFVKPVHA